PPPNPVALPTAQRIVPLEGPVLLWSRLPSAGPADWAPWVPRTGVACIPPDTPWNRGATSMRFRLSLLLLALPLLVLGVGRAPHRFCLRHPSADPRRTRGACQPPCHTCERPPTPAPPLIDMPGAPLPPGAVLIPHPAGAIPVGPMPTPLPT